MQNLCSMRKFFCHQLIAVIVFINLCKMISAVILECILITWGMGQSQYPILIVVSYDAFRYNYFNKNITPGMEMLRKEGTYADYMINVFPTKTFPNHHSISTGLYPEVHGVVGNTFFDPKLNKIVKFSYDMYHYNEKIVPIWTLNEKVGHGRYSGIMMWPGGTFSYQNHNATYVKPWDPTYDWRRRVDTVMSWILDPDKPANLIMLYFEEPDTHGHIFGPESDSVTQLIKQLDDITLYLDKQLEINQLKNRASVIHLSDHGMATVSPPHFINLTQYLQPNTYRVADTSPVLHFLPSQGFEEDVYNRLLKASKENGHFNVFRKNELLDRWHIKNNPRTPPILVLAEEGFAFQDLAQTVLDYKDKYHLNVTNTSQFGIHGYDNQMESMRPFFMVRGPNIKRAHKVPPFHTVDLFSLFCIILQIPVVKNNGTFANVRDIFIKNESPFLPIVAAMLGIAVVVIILLICTSLILLVIIKRRQRNTTAAALNKRFPQTVKHTVVEAKHLLEAEDA